MADGDDRDYVRLPEIEDVVRICRSLNEAGARYLLIGGFAVIAHGLGRTTKDIDFAETVTLQGVDIPLVSKRTLIRTKDTVRPSDRADRQFLEALLRSSGDDSGR